MVTKRVHKRQMLLIEDEHVTQVVEYTLAHACAKYNMSLHAMILEGTHTHRVDTDHDGNRPDMMRYLHSLVARQLNKYYSESDAFFSTSQTSIVHCESAEDIVRRVVYSMGNPVSDGIEREGKNHKGMRLRWPQPDRVIQRPVGFFRTKEQGGPMPDEVVLHFERPPGFEGLTDEELDTVLEGRVQAFEKAAREAREAEGLGFRCDVTDEKPDPKSFAKSRQVRFRLSPFIGAAVKEQRLAAIKRLREFRADHREKSERFKDGEREVVFPYGTYQAVQRWNVLVEPAPT